MATFDQADIFLVPLLDGSFCVGQVIDPTATETAAFCLLTDIAQTDTSPPPAITLGNVQSLLLIEPASLIDATWPIAGFEQLPDIMRLYDWRFARKIGYDGLQPHDPAIVEAFANAAFGLYPWDAFGADFFNTFLIDPKTAPPKAVLGSGRPAQ